MTDQDLPMTDRVMLAVLAGRTTREQVYRVLGPDIPAADAERTRVLDEAIDALLAKKLLETKDKTLALPDAPADERFVIEPAVRDCLPPLSAGEEAVLVRMILRSPVAPTLSIWQRDGRNVLIDGHVTSLTCRRFGRETQLVAIDLPDIQAAIEWRWDQHYGRRNLTKEAMAYCRGWQFERRKASHGGDRRSKSQNETLNGGKDPVAAALATKFGVSRPTIFRDRDYAAAIDAIAAVTGDDIRRELLARRAKQYRLTRADVMQMAQMDKAEMKKAAATLREGQRVQFRQPAAAVKSVRLKGTAAEQAQALVKSLGQKKAARLASELTRLVQEKVGQ